MFPHPELFGKPLIREEIEILSLLAAGHTRKEVAKLFGISPWMVNRKCDRIRGKLGASTWDQAMFKWASPREQALRRAAEGIADNCE